MTRKTRWPIGRNCLLILYFRYFLNILVADLPVKNQVYPVRVRQVILSDSGLTGVSFFWQSVTFTTNRRGVTIEYKSIRDVRERGVAR